MEDPAKLTDTIAANLQLSIEEKQELLEIFDPAERLSRIGDVLDVEIEKLNMDRTIQSRVKRQMEKAQKEYYLNEKIKAIQKELGRGEKSEFDELKKKIEAAGMPKEVRRKRSAGAEEAGSDAADVGRVHRLAQLSGLAAGGAVEEALEGNPQHRAPRRF
jgi:ATP-dependent Lon protease